MKTKDKIKYIEVFLLVVLMLLITGCPGNNDIYATATEQYAVGWILHNINDSTPTVLDYSEQDLAVYNYTFNYPGDSAQTYSNVLFWLGPIVKKGDGGAAAPWIDLAVPINRVYYVMGKNPVPENYRTNWSFANYMHINYLRSNFSGEQFAYEVAHQEHYKSDYAFKAITPIPGDKKKVHFGTSSFRPTSVAVVENYYNYLKLTDKIMKGHNAESYLVRKTYMKILHNGEPYEYFLDKPEYKIYLNNTLIYEGNLTDYYSVWNYDYLHYHLSSDGKYSVEIVIPSRYPLFNKTKITAGFTKPSNDMNPPVLNYLKVSPRFEVGVKEEIMVNMSDEAGIGELDIYYDNGKGWIGIPVNYAGSLYTTSFTIDDDSVSEVNLKIIAKDVYNNSIMYEIFPALMKARDIGFYLPDSDKIIIRGDTLRVKSICKDDLGINCSGLLLKAYINDEYYKSQKVSRDAILELEWNVPYDYPLDYVNVTFEFDGTGVYNPKKQTITKEITIFDHDIAVVDLEISDLKFNQEGTVSATIYNLGQSDESNITVNFYVSDKLVDSIIIPYLSSAESYEIIFNWTPDAIGWTWLEIKTEHPLDEYDENNRKFFVIEIFGEGPDIEAGYIYLGNVFINQTIEFPLTAENIGTETATNITSTLFIIEEHDTKYIYFDQPSYLEFDGVSYTVTAHLINDYFARIVVEYEDNHEEFILPKYSATELDNKMIIAINYFKNENIGLTIGKGTTEHYYMQDVLEPGEIYEKLVEWTPKEPIKYIIRFFVNANEDIWLGNNYEEIYSKVKIPGPDVSGWMGFEQPILVGQINNITVMAYNRGTEDAENVIAAIYEYEWNYTGSEYIRVIVDTIGSVEIGNLGVDEEVEGIIEWTPKEQRYYNLMLVVNATGDVDLSNNIYTRSAYARFDGPDLNVYIKYIEAGIFNVSTPVYFEIDNYGTQAATGINARLYDLYNLKYVRLNYKIAETVNYNGIEYELIVHYINESAVTINVTYENQTQELAFHNEEINTLDNDIYLSITYISTDSVRLYFCELDGIYTKDIPDMEIDGSVEKYVNWTPTTLGQHMLKIFVNTTRETNWKDNYDEEYISVVEQGPDVKALSITTEGTVIVSQTTTVYGVIKNVGTETATNITASLYIGVSVEEPVIVETEEESEELLNNYELIDTIHVGNLNKNTEEDVDFTWTPNESGHKTLLLVVNSSHDINPDNNIQYSGIRVRKNSSDLHYNYYVYNPILNQSTRIDLYINNLGIYLAQNVIIKFYDNNELFNTTRIGTIYPNEWIPRETVWWTPTYVGEHNLTLHLNYSDNLGQHEIWDTKSVTVYENLDVLMTIINPEGNYEPTYVSFDYSDFIEVTEPTIFTTPDMPADVYFIRFFGEEGGIVFDFRTSELAESMNATSKLYYNITDENVSLNILYANEVGWNYLYSEFETMFYYPGFGITDPYNIALYQCQDFDFEMKSCAGGWSVADDFYVKVSNYYKRIYIEGYSDTATEAFGVGQQET